MYWRVRGLFILIFLCFVIPLEVSSDDWQKEMGKHFVIYYSDIKDVSWAKKVLREAEGYYNKIAQHIGYSRYQNYWTWDERVKIVIYDDQKDFVQKTGLPDWSTGAAIRDLEVFRSRGIVTFKQEEGLFEGVLPHEITHLILRDFIGFDRNIPIWFDEGVAQIQEKYKRERANQVMKGLVRNEQHIPLEIFFRLDTRVMTDQLYISVFYAQSISLIDYLIKNYGSRRFGELCSQMRDGLNFEESLGKSYTNIINSSQELEKKWLSYMRN